MKKRVDWLFEGYAVLILQEYETYDLSISKKEKID